MNNQYNVFKFSGEMQKKNQSDQKMECKYADFMHHCNIWVHSKWEVSDFYKFISIFCHFKTIRLDIQ
ncbi:hypothetical protein B9T35_07230 [Acinetobacter sp. ANC 3832]|nr:hypothetical protein B9T35_07230 [Acinetobacter sp. ANC 3832]